MNSTSPVRVTSAVKEALEHLASIELINLCNEAKIERCRATRDLRSCGRYVNHVLNSCGHASLCSECSQRCDLCPICRIPILKNGNKLRIRLYNECIEAGLIPRRNDERFQEREDGKNQLNADVQRLYSFFDVALDNNLVSLICHYVTDVCMDESAVSSDPVTAFLLDEVVVKDWCKRTFQNIVGELKGIYNLETELMKSRLTSLLKYSVQLAGIGKVLEVLDLSFRDTVSAQLHDLHCLHESVLKTKQHMEVMLWCIRHDFLENVRPRHISYSSWCNLVRERKSAAVTRSWPDVVNPTGESSVQDGSLFIEDALANLESDPGCSNEMGEESELFPLSKSGRSLFLKSKMGMSGSYPFEDLRAAIDMLFLCGNSDLVVAKRAIFLYYLFDCHWTLPDDEWRDIVDDFAATFGMTRHLLMESLTFYLLDDHTDKALEEACRLLPEISGPTTHPKIPQVLLERQMPDMALMVLRWSGRDGASELITFSEAATVIRVKVECGLLTEAFTYQRMLCTKFREKKPSYDTSPGVRGENNKWLEWMEILVTEICCLCIRRNFVDRMIELPWNSDEEKYLRKCLLDYAMDDPSTVIGSLLVVYYLQRYRYMEAYQVDRELQRVEAEFMSKESLSEEVLTRIQSSRHWRARLVDKCVALLPDVQQQHMKNGMLNEISVPSGKEDALLVKDDLSEARGLNSTSFLIPTSTGSSLILPKEGSHPPLKSSIFDTPSKLHVSSSNLLTNLGSKHFPSISQEWSYMNPQSRKKPHVADIGASFKLDGFSMSQSKTNVHKSASLDRSPSVFLQNSQARESSPDHFSLKSPQNGFSNRFQNGSPYSQLLKTNTVTSPGRNHGLRSYGSELHKNSIGGRFLADADDRLLNVPSDDFMDVSWSNGEKNFNVEDGSATGGGPRWRSDETSDEEEGFQRSVRVRRVRRSKFAKT